MNHDLQISQIKLNKNKVSLDNKLVKFNFTEVNETFGQWLRLMRKQRGFSQDTLAERAHTSKSNISLIEADKIAQPRFDKLEKIAKALGISKEQIREEYARRSVARDNLFELNGGDEFEDVELDTLFHNVKRLSPKKREALKRIIKPLVEEIENYEGED